jgi:glycosyltransferase involved in cell wall biosynthesis
MNPPEENLKLSVLIVCYEMPTQIANTIQSALPPYQRNIALSDYEIVLIDNGSKEMLGEGLRKISPNLKYIYIPPEAAAPNPASALNNAAANTRAERLCLMIDGARMLTPGVLSWGIRLLGLCPQAIAEVRGWHLGPKWQPESVTEGYGPAEERRLLEALNWPQNGYRLWEVAAATPQTRHGFSSRTAESNCIFMSRDLFFRIGGFDERSRAAGGGFTNLEFFSRAVAAADPVFTILGEGTFHQEHGGAATGLPKNALQDALREWQLESAKLGHVIAPHYEFILAGHMPPECAVWLAQNCRSLS